jgi:hypothetical protein
MQAARTPCGWVDRRRPGRGGPLRAGGWSFDLSCFVWATGLGKVGAGEIDVGLRTLCAGAGGATIGLGTTLCSGAGGAMIGLGTTLCSGAGGSGTGFGCAWN